MKKLLLYSISLVTCLYFLSSGNMALFSKVKKNCNTELIDFDKDTDDKSDESEKSDNKEDYNGEEDFLIQSHLLIVTNTLLSFTVYSSENDFFILQRALEINCPPPQA